MRIGFNFAEGAEVALTVAQDGKTGSGSIARWKEAHDVLLPESGRINIVGRDASASGYPSVAQVDGTYSLDLRSGTAIPPTLFQQGNRKVKLEPTVSGQQRGWGLGEHYYLPVDTNNKAVPEPGEFHRKVHVTANPDTQWTAAKIAAAEGISAASVTATWLKAQSKYGAQTHPLEPVLGRSLFDQLVRDNRRGSSHWFLMERGYTYPATVSLTSSTNCRGESPLHPIVVGAWGTGTPPVCEGKIEKIFGPSTYLMWKDLKLLGGERNLHDTMVLMESITIPVASAGPDAQSGRPSFTYRNCRFTDAHRAVPANNKSDWTAAHENRVGSMYCANMDHLLLDGCHWSHGGWREGYDPNNGPGPQPPSMYSHNVYIQHDVFDVTYRDCLSDRASSVALRARGGGQFYDCIGMDSSIGFDVDGGVYEAHGNIGNFSLILGCLVHLAAVHHPVSQIGARAWVRNQAAQAAWVDNIIAHAIDPNNPEEIARKTAIMPIGHGEYATDYMGKSPYFRVDHDNSVIANWGGRPESKVTVSQAQAAATTGLNWYRQKSGNAAATMADFYAYTRTRPAREVVQELLAFFRQGFNAFYRALRTAATTATFRPDPRADGFRWDNRLNWSTGDIPGAIHKDEVNLHGNDVRFGNHTAEVASLALGGGIIDVVSGRLTAAAITGSGTIMVRRCGQLVTDQGSMTGKPVGISGGRIAYRTPLVSDDLTAYGRAQVLLGPGFTLPAGKTLTVEGGLPKVGWDGTGSATLVLSGTLHLRAALVLVASANNNSGNNAWNYSLEGQRVTWAGGAATVAEMLRLSDTHRELTLHGWSAVPGVGDVVDVDTVTAVSATMPTIRRFRSGMHGTNEPTVTPTVALSGPLHLDLTRMQAGTTKLIDAAITGTFSGLTVSNLNPALDATVAVTPEGVKLTLAPGSGRSALA